MYVCFKFTIKEPSKQDFFMPIVPEVINHSIDFYVVRSKLPESNNMQKLLKC